MQLYTELASSGTPKQSAQLLCARAEAYSPDESVWACANGLGLLDALMIDDAAVSANNVEDLQELITDAIVGASVRGLFVGQRALRAATAAAPDAGGSHAPKPSPALKARNGHRIPGL
jgi:DNA-binding protein YbaB